MGKGQIPLPTSQTHSTIDSLIHTAVSTSKPVRKTYRSAGYSQANNHGYWSKVHLIISAILLLQGILPEVGSAQSDRSEILQQYEKRRSKRVLAQELTEIKRLEPEVEEVAKNGNLDEIKDMVETILYSRYLGKLAKEKFLNALHERHIVLLSRKAHAEVEQEQFDRARATIQKAEVLYETLSMSGKPIPPVVSASLSDCQFEYFSGMLSRIDRAIQQNNLEKAEMMSNKTLMMLRATHVPDTELAQRLEIESNALQDKLTAAQTSETIIRAKEAEDTGDLRIARLLYEKAYRTSKSKETKINLTRIESYRRTPWLDLSLSIVVPGLGQLNSGRYLPAAGFFLGTALILSSGILLIVSAKAKYNRYMEAKPGENFEDLYEGIQTQSDIGWVLIGTASLLHIWNAVDAYTNSVRYNHENF